MRGSKIMSALRSVGFVLLVAACCGSASAATMKAVYSGTVSSGYDNIGYFGAQSSLVGQSFAVTLIYDTNISPIYAPFIEEQQINGGAGWPYPSPILSVTVSVGGQAYSYAARDGGHVDVLDGSSDVLDEITFEHSAEHSEIFGEPSDNNTIETHLRLFLTGTPSVGGPADLTQSYGLIPEARRGLSFGSLYVVRSNGEAGGIADIGFAPTALVVTNLSDTPPSTVPLPAGLPLLASALGLGLVLRRRC